MRKRCFALLTALSGLFSVTGAQAFYEPYWFQGSFLYVPNNSLDEKGWAVTVDSDGYVYALGHSVDTIVAKLRPDLTPEWIFQRDLDSFEVPRDILVANDSIYICGQAGTSGYIMKISGGGNFVWELSLAQSLNDGLWDIDLDPYDGSLWAVGTSNMWANVSRIIDHGTSGSLSFYADYRNLNNDSTYGYCIDATEDGIYLGGTAATPSGFRWWMMKRNLTDSGWQWNYTVDMATDSEMKSLRVAGGRIYSVYDIISAGTQSFVALHDPNNGMAYRTVDVYGFVAAPGGTVRSQVAVHPTLPLIAAAGCTGVKVLNLEMDQEYFSEVFPGDTNIRGVAFSPGLNFSIYTNARIGISPQMDMNVMRWVFPTRNSGKKGLVVAPNVLDVSVPGSVAQIAVTADPNAVVELRIYDVGGNLVFYDKVKTDFEGQGRMVWNGVKKDGKKLGQGTYWVSVTGGGADDKKPMLIKAGGAK